MQALSRVPGRGLARNLTFLCAAVLFSETLLYAALSPLLPALTRSFALSKSQAGLLVAAYALGQVGAALPLVFLVSRVGVRPSVVGGLALLAATSAAFGVAEGFDELLAARLLQGVAGALCWSSALAWLVDASPRERRGELIGIAMGVASSGLVAGPVFGGAAALAGRPVAFAGIALVVAGLAGAVARLRPPAGAVQELSPAGLLALHVRGQVLLGQLLLLVPGLLIGALGVLAPLRLDALGFSTAAIAATFLIAAALGIGVRPFVGRWSDRRGRLVPIRLCLAASVPVGLILPWPGSPWLLAGLVVCAFTIYEALWGPAVALLADAYEAVGIQQGAGFALMNISSGVGVVAGSAVGGLVAHLFGDVVVDTGLAVLCAVTLAGLSGREARTAHGPDRKPA